MHPYGIVVVHAMGHVSSVRGFRVDSPRNREVVDLTRKVRIVGWVVFDENIDNAKLSLVTDKVVFPVTLSIKRSDVVQRFQKKQGLSVHPLCGFDIVVPAFDEGSLVVRIGDDDPIALASFSIISMDSVSDVAHDHVYLHGDIPQSQKLSHSNFWDCILSIGNKPGLRVLEVGSRAVTAEGKGPRGRERFDQADYVGFDYYAGKNVDVVGDAHNLSNYFGKPFDLIVSFAVFEHFAMPWVVAVEMAKCLKVGGFIAVETHFSFSSHERPWHFFQYSDMALRTLFSPALGFDCLEAGVSNPIVGRFSSLADPYLQCRPVTGLYCHSEILVKKVREVENFIWSDLNLSDVVGDSSYPKPEDEN